jgi:endo-1,4-beta-D-glucanase Y
LPSSVVPSYDRRIVRTLGYLIMLCSCAGQAPVPTAQPRMAATCQLPTGADPRLPKQLYEKWKADLLTSDGAGGFLRVRRPNSGTQLNSTNSEGISYGMLLAVYLNDQPTFDALWQYEQLHLGVNGLMEWEIGPDGSTLGEGAATDGDEDMAFALVMADARWGGSGSLQDTYRHYAERQIELIWRFEVDHTRGDVLMPGDRFDGARITNISYFAPAYYRVFGAFTQRTAAWQRVVDASYRVIEATVNETGLVPAWSTPEGVPEAPPNTGHPIHHQLDSCRTPFRIAQDYCWFGDPRAQRYLEKIAGFHARVGVTHLLDGYQLDGTPFPEAKLHLAAFVAGAGAAAMPFEQHRPTRDQAYAELAAWEPLLGGSQYYNKSWSVLGALMLTGRFINLAAVPKP